jgi:hypothetical protein
MIKPNDRVYYVYNMKRTGTVVETKYRSTDMHTEGGTVQQRVFIVVRHDDGTFGEYPVDEIMRLE